MRNAETVLRAFEAQSEKLKSMASGGVGTLASRRGAEALYGRLYQELVKLGVKPQVRGKYR